MKPLLSTKLDSNFFLIDLKPANFPHFIASYVIRAEKNAIIETGPVATIPNLLTGLREIGVELKDVDYVLVSHIHLDHSGGAGSLLRQLPKAKLVVHRRGAPHLEKPEKLWKQANQERALGEVAKLYGEPIPVPRERMMIAEDNMIFDLGRGIELEVLETLGHASHHQSFYERSGKRVFPGDTAGIYIPKHDAIIPTTPPPMRLRAILDSIEKLMRLEPELIYYSHFGGQSNAMEKLQKYSDQLRLWANVIVEMMKDDATISEMKKEIEKRDSTVHKTEDYVKANPALKRGVISQNIQAFKEYFEYTNGKW